MNIYIDLETRSEADLKAVGAWGYSLHESTEILCIAIAIEDQAPQVMTPERFKNYYDAMPELRDATILAHNASFEYAMWNHVGVRRYNWLPVAPERWQCTAAQAAYFSLPRKLEKAALALGLSEQKDTEGSRVMLQLCKPRRPSKANTDKYFERDQYPDKFKTLFEYCKQDVATSQAIGKALPPLPQQEQRIWQLDQVINRRGIEVDITTITKVLSLIEEYTKLLNLEVGQITGGFLKTTRQNAKFIEFASQQGVSLPNLQAETIRQLLEEDNISCLKVKRLLEISQLLSKSSIKKYTAMNKQANKIDNRIRGQFLYCGANTGRWAGRGVQLQNLPNNKLHDAEKTIASINALSLAGLISSCGDPFKLFSKCIRAMLLAKHKHTLVIADFASIEARVIAWITGCDKALTTFRENQDIYVQMASMIFQKPEGDVEASERKLGKEAVLGCGYGMGAETFWKTCKSNGLDISEELAIKAQQTYRQTYSEIPQMWKSLERTAMKAIKSGKPETEGLLTWVLHKGFLHCKLPSGRSISYAQPFIESYENAYGQETQRMGYMREVHSEFVETTTWGGKLIENVCQAIARDLMAEAMVRLEAAGFPTVLHCHDEIVAEVPEVSPDMQKFVALMIEVPEWAKGCPVDAEASVSKRYGK